MKKMVLYISKEVCELSDGVNIYNPNTMAGAVILIVTDYDEISILSALVISATVCKCWSWITLFSRRGIVCYNCI